MKPPEFVQPANFEPTGMARVVSPQVMRLISWIVTLCLSSAAASAAEKADNGLSLLVTPKSGFDEGRGTVGTPMEFTVRFKNESGATMWLREHGPIYLVLEQKSPTPLVCGWGLGGGIRSTGETSLLKLEPGATHSIVLSVTPARAGAAKIHLRKSEYSQLVWQAFRVWHDRPGQPRISYLSRRRVRREGLWTGSIRIEFPVTIRRAGGLGSPERNRELASLYAGEIEPEQAVECWARWNKQVPDERLVDALRTRLKQGRAATGERTTCIALLVSAAQRGYGADALRDLVAIAGDAAAPIPERVQAVAVLATASKPCLDVWQRSLKYRLAVPDDVQVKAKALLEQLAASHIPALRRAAAK